VWTYRKPYYSEEFTQQYIKTSGRVALSRALNVNRVIAFVGSGATTAYGRPSWNDLIYAGLSAVGLEKDEINGTASGRGASHAVVDTIKRLKSGADPSSENNVNKLEAAENYARLIGKSTIMREKIAKLVCKGREEVLKDKHKKALEMPNDSESFISGNKQTFVGLSTNKTWMAAQAQPIERLVQDLGIRRFLTLNYDVEIERTFQKQYRTTGLKTKKAGHKSDFEYLCDKGAGDGRILDDRVEYSDGTTRSVLSVCLNGNNVGDLTSFALFSSQYVGQVFHLHGRYDKPSTMVLTQKDYHKTYFKTEKQRYTFEEAFSSVFTGNDVLFVGVGMSEHDILRPLRQFMSRDKRPDSAKRHVFSLLPKSVSVDQGYLVNEHCKTDIDELKKIFSALHFADDKNDAEILKKYPSGNAGGSREKDQAVDENQALMLKSQYGIYTLYYGTKASRTVELTCELLLKCLTTTRDGDPTITIRPENCGICPVALQAALQNLLERLETLKSAAAEAKATPLLSESEYIILIELVTAFEQNFDKQNPDPIPDSLKKIINYAKYEAKSRSLDRELRKLKTRQDQWWSDWRESPEHRKPKFAPQSIDTNPCFSRHKPVYSPLDISNSTSFQAIADLRTEASKVADKSYSSWIKYKTVMAHRPPFNCPGRRVLRVTLDRGHGKGSLLHILTQVIPNGDIQKTANGTEIRKDGKRLYLDSLFHPTEDYRYFRSFVLHLSFSMEFSSVISALSTFYEDAILKSLERHHADFKSKFSSHSLAATFPRQKRDLLQRFQETVNKPNNGLKADLNTFWEDASAAHGTGRIHRLEQLRMRMWAYTHIVDVLKDRNLRLFIAMSGLDRLCDARGFAHNPMYRAFFRLLSGCGQKYDSESDPDAPVDILFISGTPSTPIRYLSEEISKDDLRVLLERKPPLSGNYASYSDYRVAGGELMMRKWPQISKIEINERYWITCNEFRDPAKSSTCYPAIHQLFSVSVALSSWCYGAYKQSETLGDNINAKDWLSRLDAASSRGGTQMVIDEVLRLHKTVLRSISINTSKLPKQITFEQASSAKDSFGNELVELTYLLLSHLALFPMPIEPRVLYGSDEIKELLHRIYSTKLGLTDDKTDAEAMGKTTNRRTRRRTCLRILFELLKYLHESHLVIRVFPKPTDAEISGQSPVTIDTDEENMEIVHSRYIIQHQLRDYAAKGMDLTVPDNGERNYFLVSIYCDQPKDLPTPRAEHYKLIRSIFDRQINQTRNTLWCMMQFDQKLKDYKDIHDLPPERFDRLPQHFTALAASGLKRRLLVSTIDATGNKQVEFDYSLQSIHAVSQRIRALYGMLRSGFTVGTISRLSQIDEGEIIDQPYERFRGWLRALTNAAIGFDKIQDSLKAICSAEIDNKFNATMKEIYSENPDYSDLSNAAATSNRDIKKQKKNIRLPSNPLYRDEIGWLLNERGLISLVQGNIFDAIPLFNRALNVMYHQGKEAGNDPALHAAVRRVRFNLALALIQRGHLERAKLELRDLVLPEDFASRSGSQISWLAEGYISYVNHHSGNFANVEKGYQKIIEMADEREMLRLSSIFNCHLAELLLRKKNFAMAQEKADLAIANADQSEQRDVLHLANVTLAKISALGGKPTTADPIAMILDAIDYSRQMGIPHLECRALQAHAEILLSHNDRILAGEMASFAGSIANRCGMRLEKLSSLLLYSEALINRGQSGLAQSILLEVQRDAERHSFQLIAGRIRLQLSRVEIDLE